MASDPRVDLTFSLFKPRYIQTGVDPFDLERLVSRIDRWEDWDAQGVKIEDEIARVDVAYLDGTFFADGELPGRDMSMIPHPMITKSMERFAALPKSEREKVRFIHLNWSNPARFAGSPARAQVENAGFRIAEENERLCL